MFKEILSGFKKVFNRKELIIALVVVVIAVALLSYSGSKTFSMDGMESGYVAASEPAAAAAPVAETTTESVPAGYGERPVNTAGDLFPSAGANEWSELNPGLNAGSMPDLDRITPIATPPNRNANLQFRSDIPIPKADVGPWNQSTILPDVTRAPLEIGH